MLCRNESGGASPAQIDLPLTHGLQQIMQVGNTFLHFLAAVRIGDHLALLWRREFQNKNGANSKTTEYAANIQKADLEEALQARYLMCSVQFPAVALQL